MAPSRIPLNYFTTPSTVERWKGRLGWVAAVLCGLWMGSSFLLNKEVNFHSSRGHVAGVHQAWNDQCSTCHEPFQAMSSTSWTPAFLPFLTAAAPQHQKCQACHLGPDHHASATPEMSCATCHREHRGLEASLTRLADPDCTQCHGDLAGHYKAGTKSTLTPPTHNAIPVFAKDAHPTFRSLTTDPGKLKFDHRRHLTAGMPAIDPKTGAVGGGVWRLSDIPPADRERYRSQQPPDKRQDSDFVQLSCTSCHRQDTADFGFTPAEIADLADGLRPQRAPGAYMLPITFDNQCKACHALSVAETLPGGKLQAVAVPHRLQPPALDKLLSDYFTAQAARGQAGFFERKVPLPLPGKLPESLLTPELKDLVAKNLRNAADDLYARPAKKNCSLCHDLEKEPPVKGHADWKVLATNIPQIWLQHGRFDHAAHRAVDCKQCHDKAETSSVNTDVLVPNIDNCLTCHGPATTVGGKASGGVRYNCTECHRYHNAAFPQQGIGAARRSAPFPATLQDLLKGNLKHP